MFRRQAEQQGRYLAQLGAMLLAFAWLLYLGYGHTILPTHISWMFRNDWAAYLWGFCFFRNAEWAYPLGNTPNLFYPFGTSVGFTDANPWMSLLFRMLSGALPIDFQFAGIWYLLCYLLQAYFGARIVETFTRDPLQIACGGALFALTPILPIRAPHVALCAIFFVTAGIWLNLRKIDDAVQAKRTVVLSLVLLAWVAGTHGYLSVMLLAMCFPLYVRLCLIDRMLTYRQGLLAAGSALIVTLVTYYLFGYIGWKSTDLTAEGFGQFSGDLTAFVNAQGWSRFVPALPHRPRQWEGFSYLGLGVLGLLLCASVTLSLSARETWAKLKRQALLIAAALVLLFYSWSSHVAFLGEPVLDLSALYRGAEAFTGIFRSSGRFSWPLHLLLITGAVYGVARIRRLWIARSLIALALLVQAAEFDPARLNFAPVPIPPLNGPAWEGIATEYSHLELVPLQLLWVCPYDHDLVNQLSYRAYRSKLTFNSGNFMRKEPGVERLCGKHLTAVDPQTLYVVSPSHLRDFRGKNAACGELDGLIVCVDAGRRTQMRQALEASRLL